MSDNASDKGATYLDGESVRANKKFCLRAAKELGYSPEVIERLHEATTLGEIDRAMKMGRRQRFGS